MIPYQNIVVSPNIIRYLNNKEELAFTLCLNFIEYMNYNEFKDTIKYTFSSFINKCIEKNYSSFSSSFNEEFKINIENLKISGNPFQVS